MSSSRSPATLIVESLTQPLTAAGLSSDARWLWLYMLILLVRVGRGAEKKKLLRSLRDPAYRECAAGERKREVIIYESFIVFLTAISS